MSRTSKRKEIGEAVDINELRSRVKEELINRYGSIKEFLKSEKGKKMGGSKIRHFLYPTSTINSKVTGELCEYLGIGYLTKKTTIVRSVTYYLSVGTPS